ncbi:MAG: thermonuclease family protein [Rhizomicrobium sp.]
MRLTPLFLGLGMFAALPAGAAALPACAGGVEISDAILLRVEQNGSVIFTDGRAVHLEGIRLPRADRAPQPLSDKALGTLASLLRKAPLTLTAVAPKEDRYDRVRGQLFTGDKVWIQVALLKSGLARVAIAPDRTECAGELFAAEAQARAARAGLWALPAFAIRTPETVGRDTGTFQVVQGKVLEAGLKNGRAYLNFGTDWRSDFTVSVAPEDMANFRRTGVDPRSYLGQTIRVRGIVQSHNGPEIGAANPQGIEVVGGP